MLQLDSGCRETDPSFSCSWHPIMRDLPKITSLSHTTRSLWFPSTCELQSMRRDGLGSSLVTLYAFCMVPLQDSIAIYLSNRRSSYGIEPLKKFNPNSPFHPCVASLRVFTVTTYDLKKRPSARGNAPSPTTSCRHPITNTFAKW